MGVKANFSKDDVRKRFDKFLAVVEEKQIARLQRLGEKCLIQARDTNKGNTFQDQTGNLRSSIGYMVFKDGVAIHNSDFDQVSPKADTTPGVEYNGGAKGKAFCESIGSKTTGISLVVVAGMEYAVYVEAKGRDVLTSAEHLAERELPKELAKLIDNIKKA